MTLLIFGLIYGFSMVAVAVVAYQEGRGHAQQDQSEEYSTGHSDGFEDGWQAAQQVNRVTREVGGRASW